MSESVRCPACRGSKKVAKLGGIIGECNTCKGEGTILASEKFVPEHKMHVSNDDAIVINQVADCVPVTVEERTVKMAPVEGNIKREIIKESVEKVKADNKRAIYKRKKSA